MGTCDIVDAIILKISWFDAVSSCSEFDDTTITDTSQKPECRYESLNSSFTYTNVHRSISQYPINNENAMKHIRWYNYTVFWSIKVIFILRVCKISKTSLQEQWTHIGQNKTKLDILWHQDYSIWLQCTSHVIDLDINEMSFQNALQNWRNVHKISDGCGTCIIRFLVAATPRGDEHEYITLHYNWISFVINYMLRYISSIFFWIRSLMRIRSLMCETAPNQRISSSLLVITSFNYDCSSISYYYYYYHYYYYCYCYYEWWCLHVMNRAW